MAKRRPPTARQRASAGAGAGTGAAGTRGHRGSRPARSPQDEIRHLATRELLRRAALATPLLGGLVILALLAFSIGSAGNGPRTTEEALTSTTRPAASGPATGHRPGGGGIDANAETGSATAAGGDDGSPDGDDGSSDGDDGRGRARTSRADVGGPAGAGAAAAARGRGGRPGEAAGAEAGGSDADSPLTDCAAYPPRITVHLPWCTGGAEDGDPRHQQPGPSDVESAAAPGPGPDVAATAAGAGGGRGVGDPGAGHVVQSRRGGHARSAGGHRAVRPRSSTGRRGPQPAPTTVIVTPLAMVTPTITSVVPPPRSAPAAAAASPTTVSRHRTPQHHPARSPRPHRGPGSDPTRDTPTAAQPEARPDDARAILASGARTAPGRADTTRSDAESSGGDTGFATDAAGATSRVTGPRRVDAPNRHTDPASEHATGSGSASSRDAGSGRTDAPDPDTDAPSEHAGRTDSPGSRFGGAAAHDPPEGDAGTSSAHGLASRPEGREASHRGGEVVSDGAGSASAEVAGSSGGSAGSHHVSVADAVPDDGAAYSDARLQWPGSGEEVDAESAAGSAAGSGSPPAPGAPVEVTGRCAGEQGGWCGVASGASGGAEPGVSPTEAGAPLDTAANDAADHAAPGGGSDGSDGVPSWSGGSGAVAAAPDGPAPDPAPAVDGAGGAAGQQVMTRASAAETVPVDTTATTGLAVEATA